MPSLGGVLGLAHAHHLGLRPNYPKLVTASFPSSA